MITLKDKSPDIWASSHLNNMDIIWYEDGTTKELTTKDVVFDRGKYNGMLLSELHDMWYLDFLLKIAVEKKDDFLKHCATMRKLELS